MSGLSEERWEALRAMWATGLYSLHELGRQFGVSHTAIRKRASKFGWVRNIEGATEFRAARKLEEKISDKDSEVPKPTEKFPSGWFPFQGQKPDMASQLSLVEESVVEMVADRVATENLAALSRVDDIKRIRNRLLEIVEDVISGDPDRTVAAAPYFLIGKGDSLSSVLKTLAVLDENIQKTIRTALGLDKQPKRLEISGPGGAPIRTQNANFDVSKLTTDQLAVLNEVSELIEGEARRIGPPMPPEGPEA